MNFLEARKAALEGKKVRWVEEKFLSKYEEWLWKVAQHYLAPYAVFIPNEARFKLLKKIFLKLNGLLNREGQL